jgi:hypothetical protein
MTTKFHTSVDCVKRFMGAISGLSIAPIVGDLVRVYHDSEIEIQMQVIGRTWEFTNGASPVLICELGIPPYFENIPKFTAFISSHGFH